MSREEVWQSMPVSLRNTALGIARAYGHGWAWSTVVPIAPSFWEYDDVVPSLEEIEEGTPEGPLGKGITGPDISFRDGRYFVFHKTGTGRVTIEVSVDPVSDPGTTYEVVVSRPNGDSAVGIRDGKRTEDNVRTFADWSIWGIRHENAWKKAWVALGIPAPEFPGKLLEKELVVSGNLEGDPLYSKVKILPKSVLSVEDLLRLRRAASVEIVDEVGQVYPLIIG